MGSVISKDAKERFLYTLPSLLQFRLASEPLDKEVRLTVEPGMLPHFFLQGKGYHTGVVSFVDCYTLRMHQVFSLYTLDPIYVSKMYSVPKVSPSRVHDKAFANSSQHTHQLT